MANFKNNRRSDGSVKNNSKNYMRYERPESGSLNIPKKMYKANCTECGAKCEVPFKPQARKPVLCDNCFGGPKKVESRSRSSHENQSPSLKKELDQINAKLDRILRIIEK